MRSASKVFIFGHYFAFANAFQCGGINSVKIHSLDSARKLRRGFSLNVGASNDEDQLPLSVRRDQSMVAADLDRIVQMVKNVAPIKSKSELVESTEAATTLNEVFIKRQH